MGVDIAAVLRSRLDSAARLASISILYINHRKDALLEVYAKISSKDFVLIMVQK